MTTVNLKNIFDLDEAFEVVNKAGEKKKIDEVLANKTHVLI